jgi:hypothetical protein
MLPAWLMMGYIDPGSGTLLLQAILAAAVGSAFAFRQGLAMWVRRMWPFGSRS